MSSGVDVQRRPNIWSYLSFSGTRRRTSISLPHSSADTDSIDDRYEKPDRHSHARRRSATSMSNQGGGMNQGQRVRYLKVAGILAVIIFALYYLVPQDRISQGKSTS